MKKLIPSFLFTISIIISTQATVPVLLWGKSCEKIPALTTLGVERLGNILSPLLKNNMLLVFIENELDLEDLTSREDKTKESCYGKLSDLGPDSCYLWAKNPISNLKSLRGDKTYISADENGTLSSQIIYSPGKVVFIQLNEIEDCGGKQKRANLIAEIYERISSIGKTIAVYTGQNLLTRSREKRQAEKKPYIENIDNKVLLYFTNLMYKEGDGEASEVHITNSIINSKNESTYNVELTGTNLKFTFTLSKTGGYWYMLHPMWNSQKLKSDQDISAADAFSYYCPRIGLTHKEDKGNKILFSITWSGLQLQPQFGAEQTTSKFRDAWHCVGFTTPVIWSSLFVTFMLIGILSVGISWLMDINTMDRFDDPKGKTITINAE